MLWTHNLKSLELVNYRSPKYTGKALRMGAGIQAYEAYEFVDHYRVRVVDSECSTVGLAGGFTQGGGHSILSSSVGLAADNALEWGVVTVEGKHLIASETENPDLYWALNGGGGGTYAVVLSLTTKAFEDGHIGGAALSFNISSMSLDTYWTLFDHWQAGLPALVDAGGLLIYQLRNTSFNLLSATFLDRTKEEVDKSLSSFTTLLKYHNVTYTYSSTYSPTYLQHFSTYFGPPPQTASIPSANSSAAALFPVA